MPTPKDPERQQIMSVQDRTESAFAEEAPLVFYMASLADTFPEWPSKVRDRRLDAFWPEEPLLAGAVYSMCTKVAALDFKLTGPRKSVAYFENVFKSADIGLGWPTFVSKVVQDLLTQDNGAFMEVLRPEGADAGVPVHGLAHLDSQLCTRTGDVQVPVSYRESSKKAKKLKWYEVIPISDMPSPRRKHKGIGYCAVSRVLRAAQTLRDVGIYKRQKLSGKRVPALMFVKGLRRKSVEDALKQAQEEQMEAGLTVYTKPVILASPDPGVPVEVQLVELAGLPDGYNEDTLFKWYIATLALDFGTDYTEFAPLPGGNLGSATQATLMASRARGKGPGMTLQQFEFHMNWYVLPKTVEFQFASTDPTAERERMEMRVLRARDRTMRLRHGELTVEQSLKLAVLDGDAPESFLGEPTDERAEEIERIIKAVKELRETLEEVRKTVNGNT